MIVNAKAADALTSAASYKTLIKNQQTFTTDNYKAEKVLKTRRSGKIIKLFRYFGCDKCYEAKLMSSFLMICTNCFSPEHFENERSRQRFIEKTLNKIGTFLRRRI